MNTFMVFSYYLKTVPVNALTHVFWTRHAHLLRARAAGFLGTFGFGKYWGTLERVGAPTRTPASARAFVLCDTRANTLSRHSLITAIVQGSTNAQVTSTPLYAR